MNIDTIKNLVKKSNKYDVEGQFLKANLLDEEIKRIRNTVVASQKKKNVQHYMSLPEKDQIVKEARDWLKDCEWTNLEENDIDRLSDVEVLGGVENHYDGGIHQLVRDCLMEGIV